MNRPEVRNALSTELFEALYAALGEADADDAVRAVVLTGTDPAFCAGVDLKQAQRLGMDYFARFDKMNCMNRIVAAAQAGHRRGQRCDVHRRTGDRAGV